MDDEPVGRELTSEQDDLLNRFVGELRHATEDGGRKRRDGIKKPWWIDETHEAAIFSHLTRWKRGELEDPDSGAHPLVHAAWRCLAIACQETGNVPRLALIRGEPYGSDQQGAKPERPVA